MLFRFFRTLAAPQYGYASRTRHDIITRAIVIAAVMFTAPSAHADTLRIVVFGDSLTAGYRLPPSEAFPVRLEQALRQRGWDVTLDNAGVSGDTASAGAARLDWSVPEGTDGVILELGANDALRGVDPAVTRAALARILDRLAERHIPVLLAGMFAPRNLGQDYTDAFDRIYPDLAAEYGVPLYPFFLDGVAGERTLNLDDGIHPNEAGIAIMVERMTPAVEAFLTEIRKN